MDADCCGICCCCIACFGCVASAFRYMPFHSVSKIFGCDCYRPKGEDAEEDYDNIAFPTAHSQFTPDGQRIHPYTHTNTPPMPKTMRSTEHTTSLSLSESQMALASDSYAIPPGPHRNITSSPPPYPFAVREGAGFGSDEPRTHRTESSLGGGNRSAQLESAGLGRPQSNDLSRSSP
ncbi:hypothetical protein C8F04DRAFT_1121306 [Mycena alexandri]|uniref:Uncharacterized protein n=1 Tax=Mycena alexandri TaxID=1745969 RepID=A0AAD6X0H5_9AGAR|nr:hypothetical protein C8F04DRAFT_1121306 [Mycena alexandri]